MVSRRYIKGRAFMAAAATSMAAVGMIAFSATALADDAAASGDDAPKCITPLSDGTCPAPGTTVFRGAPIGTANGGPSTVLAAPRGTTYSDGDDVSKGAAILIHDGSPSPLCYASQAFDAATCGFDENHGIPQLP